jgi:hypothetical protein
MGSVAYRLIHALMEPSAGQCVSKSSSCLFAGGPW